MTQDNSNTPTIDRRGQRGVNLRVRPRFGIGDIVLQLWRSLWLMILVFIPIVILGVLLAMSMSKKYTAYGTAQVSLDNQYVYDPLVGDAGRGVSLEIDAILRAEVEKANSPVLARRVLEKLSIERVYPKIAEEMAKTRDSKKLEDLKDAAYETFAADAAAGNAPKSPLLTFSFTHQVPEISALVVNEFLEQFQDYREDRRSQNDVDAVAGQRRRVGASLATAEQTLRDFLVKHDIGEFETDRESIAKLLSDLRDELLRVEAAGKEAEGRLSGLRAVSGSTPETIDIHVDNDAKQRLLDLQLEREQLLLRYLPDSRAVQEIDARINGMKSLLQSGDGGVRRSGPNPAHQELVSNINIAQSEVEASRSRAAELRRQMNEVAARQRKLISVQPEYKKLLRERDILETAMYELSTKEQAKKTEAEISQNSNSNITIVDFALVPTKGTSMKIPVAFASVLFGGFTALIAGLLAAFSRKGLSTRRSTEKTIGLPVIGVTSKQ